ncbi:MAG: HAD family hydrolase [Planctomycetota bacterium]|jgi:putative hydrolase of the HAD superfamily
MAVIFDIDDTLLDHSGAVRAGISAFYATYASELEHDADAFVDFWFELAEAQMARYLAGEVGYHQQRRERMRVLFGPLADDEAEGRFAVFLDAYRAAWSAFADTIGCLEHLRADGWPLAVISNGDGEHQRRKLAVCGIDHFFDLVVTPGEGIPAKPHSAIFHHTCAKLDCAPAACIYVGDKLHTDAHGARAAGLQALWLQRPGCATPTDHGAAAVTGHDEDIKLITGLAALPATVSDYLHA